MHLECYCNSVAKATRLRRAMRRATSLLALALVLSSNLAAAQHPGPEVHVQPPVRRKHVDPEYPKSQLASGKDVEVVLTLTIDAEGKVEKAEVALSGGKDFDFAALEAVKQWEFDPATRDGRPVHAKIRVPFHFAPPHQTTPRATSTVPSQAAEEEERHAAPKPVEPEPEIDSVTIFGRSHIPARGVGDFDMPIGKLRAVPQRDAAGLLRMAPGVTLQNEGGSGHPYQIFMRGFDAREGQDVEMNAGGIPINEPGNVHGAGLADTHFLIPEVVRRVRVIEGPFAPQQGNFAVAGSVLFDLGVEDVGMTAKITAGSFATRRLLVLWRPEGCSERTFAAGEIWASEGYGRNRATERASAIGGYEGRIGESLVWRLLVTSYANHYQQAGVVREDDVRQNKIGFYDTYDAGQGGDSSRHSIGLLLSDKLGAVRLRQEAFGILRDQRIRDNFTGFVEDPRGDMVDQQTRSATAGARGSARMQTTAFREKQEIELGYYARYDGVTGIQDRDRSGTALPYQRDIDLDSGLSNLALYVDSSLKPRRWMTLRGGLRADLFHSRVTDKLTQETASHTVSAWQPRATLLLGPYRDFTFSTSVGQAARTFAPQDILRNAAPPVATATSYEAGLSYDRPFGATELHARSVFFDTELDHDLAFDETTGRSTLAPGATRAGWSGSVRATGRFFDVASSVTFARATEHGTHALVPFTPPIVLRADVSLFADLPWPTIGGRKISATMGIGGSYVGRRPLPENSTSADSFVLDAGGSLRWRSVELGLSMTNLLDARYRIGEFNYVSDFGTQPGKTTPVRHFVAGEPLGIFATLGITFGASR